MLRTLFQYLVFFLCIGSLQAKELFVLPDNTPYLQITPHRPEVPPFGPTDFTVIHDLIAVLDSTNQGISFFDKHGSFVKRIALPHGYYERLVRDRDGSLIAFAYAGGMPWTRMVHIQGEVVEQTVQPVTTSNLVSHVVVDDLGLSFEIVGELDLQKLSNKQNCDSCLYKEAQKMFQQINLARVNRDCFQCELAPSKGAMIRGVTYHIDYEREKGQRPTLIIGNRKIKLDHIHKNGGTHIEQVDQDGTAWVSVSVSLDDKFVDFLWKINNSGAIQAIYQMPKNPPNNYDYVLHSISISENGNVYMMMGQTEGLVFYSIPPLTPMEKEIFIKKHLHHSTAKKKTSVPFSSIKLSQKATNHAPQAQCQTRNYIFIMGLRYLYYYQCLPDSAIYNDESCPGRIMPPYLVDIQSKCMFSISYSWGGFDGIESYDEKILHMKAGNVNTAISPLTHCAAGVDCSGFVSQLWGLPFKWGTSAIFENTFPVALNDMQAGDVFVKPNNHVLMFASRMNDDIATFESTANPGQVIISHHDYNWFEKKGYLPRLAFNTCE